MSASKADCKQPMMLLESNIGSLRANDNIDNNFLVQASDKTTRSEILLDLMLTSAKEIIKRLRF